MLPCATESEGLLSSYLVLPKLLTTIPMSLMSILPSQLICLIQCFRLLFVGRNVLGPPLQLIDSCFYHLIHQHLVFPP